MGLSPTFFPGYTSMDGSLWAGLAALVLVSLYGLGVASAVDAILRARTAQGATAWAVGLALMPLVALPAYWVFGRSRFGAYADAVRSLDRQVTASLRPLLEGDMESSVVHPEKAGSAHDTGVLRGFSAIASVPFLRGNGVRLLVDGAATFEAIHDAIDGAERYLLVQFYTIRDDRVGREFHDRLVAAARRGVRICLLYDEVGSYGLPEAYCASLRDAGIQVAGFGGRRGWLGRFRINFRNHRKILVADGTLGLVGGLNIGDEYLGSDPDLSPWRDTHVAVRGPLVQELQLTFLRDWRYGQGELPEEMVWDITPSPENRRALLQASGPADPTETCRLMFAHAIGAAIHRVWIATPYFVPDGHILGALQAAAMRGVDVRVLSSRTVDNALFRYVPYAYIPDVERAGVKVFLYEEGFLHQKAFLVDDRYAAVGSANLDNRSLRLNFEVTAIFDDRPFAAEVAEMLERDFAQSTQLTETDLEGLSRTTRIGSRIARLLAPAL